MQKSLNTSSIEFIMVLNYQLSISGLDLVTRPDVRKAISVLTIVEMMLLIYVSDVAVDVTHTYTSIKCAFFVHGVSLIFFFFFGYKDVGKCSVYEHNVTERVYN